MHSYMLLLSSTLLLIGVARSTPSMNSAKDSNPRSKRFIHYTSDNRLTLPPGTLLVLTPVIQLPVHRNLPVGYGSHMTVSIPFSINFDDLGFTSEENPWALWPDFGIFSKRRADWSPVPGVNWAGGDREVMFQVIEDAISNVGISGKACLLRAICEMFETPLLNHGLFADFMELFFSASKAPQADKRLAEYLEAENLGKHNKTCSKFYSGCENSLFSHNGQSKKKQPEIHEDHENTEKDQDPTWGLTELNSTIDSNIRSKRFIHLTSDNRLTLPPGTLLVLVPTLQLPVYRNLPVGYGSHMTVSIPFSIEFDDLGLTSTENPWGLWPEFGNFSEKREENNPVPGVNRVGGDREVMFQFLEDAISNLGISGKSCLLRAICEMFETSLQNHGLLADFLELFFSVSKSPQADERLAEYLEAENLGKHNKSCSKFYSGCENSLFSLNGQNKNKQPESHEDYEHPEKDQEYTDKHSHENSLEEEDPTWGLRS